MKPTSASTLTAASRKGPHEAVKRIVGMAGGQGTTISGYIDNIVTEHLERHGAELEGLRKRKSHGIVEPITISLW